jgi:hypothetical protein
MRAEPMAPSYRTAGQSDAEGYNLNSVSEPSTHPQQKHKRSTMILLTQPQNQTIDTWLQGPGKNLACAVCGKPGPWERRLFSLSVEAGFPGVRFLVLT